jgi:hypothetical protein
MFCLDDLPVGDRGVLKSPTTTVLAYICDYKAISSCLMKLGVPTLGTYKTMIVISSWCIAPFISMKCPSLCLLTNLCLKSILYDVNIAIPACFMDHQHGKSSTISP